MSAEKLLTFLVFAAIATFALGMGLSFLETEPPEAIIEWFDTEGAGPLTALMHETSDLGTIVLLLVLVTLVVAYAAALIGLLYFKRWAWILFIILIAIEFAMLPLMGTSYVTPVSNTADALLHTIQGALLVAILTDPIRSRFSRASTT